MANEAVIIELLGNKGDPINYTVASGAAIVKGELLKITDPRTASLAGAKHDIVAGIAASGKDADDFSTTLAVYTNGIFDMQLGTVTAAIGDLMGTSGANFVASLTQSGANVLGYALETGAAGEKIAVRVLV